MKNNSRYIYCARAANLDTKKRIEELRKEFMAKHNAKLPIIHCDHYFIYMHMGKTPMPIDPKNYEHKLSYKFAIEAGFNPKPMLVEEMEKKYHWTRPMALDIIEKEGTKNV